MMLLDLEHAHYASATLQTLHQFLVYRYVDIIHIVVDMMITVFFSVSCLPFTVLGFTTILIYEHEHEQ